MSRAATVIVYSRLKDYPMTEEEWFKFKGWLKVDLLNLSEIFKPNATICLADEGGKKIAEAKYVNFPVRVFD